MGSAKVYTDDEARAALAGSLAAWTLEGGHLARAYDTGDWAKAMMLANVVSFLAESAGHHPEMRVTWGRVGLRLRTHEPDGITDKDLELARQIEALAASRPSSG